MAKLIIEVDTEAKTISAEVDGEVIDNFYSASVYQYGGHYDCQVTQREQLEDGVFKTTQLTAYASKSAKAAVDSGAKVSEKYPGFVEVTRTPLGKFIGSQMDKFRT